MAHSLPTDRIAANTGATSAHVVESIQSLWSGYGQIVRVRLIDAVGGDSTVIVKHVCPPTKRDHKYGWSGGVSHQRKLSSYENERNWYRGPSDRCSPLCRVPKLLAAESTLSNETRPDLLLVLEDLDAAGFDRRCQRPTDVQVQVCLKWLANYHATFLADAHEKNAQPVLVNAHGLWPVGTYWHLATRPDELNAMPAGPLKQAAPAIDSRLSQARFQTLVHGDAKLANFCFSSDDQVAAVDFQYVGGGCGMKDVAYFISSCFHEDECEHREQELLGLYFASLKDALEKSSVKGLSLSFADLEAEWRSLYPYAWADFYRFLSGWSPGHWKMHAYSQRMADLVVQELA